MPYATGSRIGIADPAEDCISLITAAMQAQGNWTFIEDWTVSTTTHSVWRCNGAGNSFGQDFFVIFSRSNAAGTALFYVGTCEQYATSNHAYTHAVPSLGSTVVTPQPSTFAYLGTATALTAGFSPATLLQPAVTVSSGAYDYHLLVTGDGFVVSTRVGTTSYGVLCMAYDSFINPPGTDVYPYVLCSLNAGMDTSGVAWGGCTRAPLVTAAQSRIFGVRTPAAPASTIAWTYPATVFNQVGGDGSLWQQQRPLGSRIGILSHNTHLGSGNADTAGDFRGLYKHLLYFNTGAAVVAGDTITVEGRVYVFLGNSGVWLDTQGV